MNIFLLVYHVVVVLVVYTEHNDAAPGIAQQYSIDGDDNLNYLSNSTMQSTRASDYGGKFSRIKKYGSTNNSNK